MSQNRRIKLKVNGADQVKAALTFLFADGCRWTGATAGTDVDYRPSATHLFVDDKGHVTYIDDGDDKYFRAQSYKEVIPKWDTATVTTVTMSIEERPKTLLFGKMYYTDELNARLAGLEVAK